MTATAADAVVPPIPQCRTNNPESWSGPGIGSPELADVTPEVAPVPDPETPVTP